MKFNKEILLQSSRLQWIVSLVLAAAAWATVWYKAIVIPITHDELATIIHYYRFSVWEIMMYPDPWPSNHILNTLLTKLSMNLFGMEQWAARLPNVLSFLLYFYAAWRICRQLLKENNLLFFSALSWFLFNPFLLDFFSLCRGYGLSNALMLLAAMHCLEGFMQQRERAVWLGFAFGLLASYANFTLLIFWCAVNGVAVLFFWNTYLRTAALTTLLRSIGILAIIDVAYLALIITPIRKMQSTNQFVYWQSNGFFRDTIVSLVENTRYGAKIIDLPHDYYAMLTVLLFFTAGAYMMYHWGRHGWQAVVKQPIFIAFVLLALMVFVNIMQTIILKTPNLTTRTALGFYPLFILLMSSMLYVFYAARPRLVMWIGVVLLLLNIWHFQRTFTPDRTREWWYDANTFQVLDALKSERKDENTAVSLQTGWHFHRSFDFYVQTGKASWLDLQEYNKDIEPEAAAQFYYVFDSDYPLLQENYDVFRKFDGGSRLLLRRKSEAK